MAEELKVYDFLGGGQVKGASNDELVNMMRSSSHTPTSDLQEFMEQTARRCRIQRGSIIRTGSTDLFIQDLLSEGFLVPVQ